MIRLRRSAAWSAVVLLAAGCAAPPSPAPPILPAVQDRHERRLADGRLNVAVVLGVEPGAGARPARITCQFRDGAGQPAGTAAAQIVTVDPGVPLTVQFASPTAAAATATVAIAPP